MKGAALFILILLLSVLPSSIVNGQNTYECKYDHDTIDFIDFVEEVERNSDIRFYFIASQVDSLTFLNVDRGNSLDLVLDKGLQGTGLLFDVDESNYFIFHGSPLLNSLPEYQLHVKRETSIQEPGSDEDTKYLQTSGQLREKLITVGKEHKAQKGKKCRVIGSVRSKSNGEELIGATIYIRELQLGTISDVSGVFSFEVPPGLYIVSINHMAMKEVQYDVNVLSDGMMTIELEDELIQLQEIMVVDKRRGNVDGMLMGYERITTKSMREIPLVMGEKDLLKVAQMLPGVQNVGEGSSGFNVRGGSPDQNMFYINNISVYNTSHLFGFFTAFSPDIISDFSLYKNNIPLKYGGRIASIFEINTREGNTKNFFAQGGLSPITGHVALEGPIIKEKVTFVSSIRSTYSDWILKRIKDNDLQNSNASFYDGTFGINADLNENNRIKTFFYTSSDKFSLSTKNEYAYQNLGGSASWKHKFTDSFSSDFSLASSNYSFENIDKNNITEAYTQDYSIHHSEFRSDFIFLANDKHRIEFGFTSVLYDLNRGTIIPYGEESKRIALDLGTESGLENSLYISDEFQIIPRVNLLLGMRYSYYMYLGPSEVFFYEEGLPKNKYTVTGSEQYDSWDIVNSYSGFEPRAALNLKLGQNSSLKASYNRLQQYIFLLSNTIALSPTDQWKLTDYHTSPPVSDQISTGFYKDFPDAGLNISLEVYKKWINNIVEYKDGVDFISGEPIERQTLQGFQDSRGVEFMIKKNTRKLTGWLSYTYSRSFITVDGEYEELRLNEGSPYPSNYDRPHSFNLVANYRLSRRVSLSSNVVYTSGRPVTLPIALYYTDAKQYLYYSDRNKYRIPDYFRVDFSINLEGNLKYKKIAHSYWMLNVYNLTGRDNAYSVFYEARYGNIRGYKLSIFAQPILTLSWNFKFGNYNSD